MNNVFTLSITVIGGVIGFILGVTIGFAINTSLMSVIYGFAINTSLMSVIYGFAIVFAVVGGFGFSKLSSLIDNQDPSTKKALTVLCAIIAIVMFALLILTITMLQYFV